MKKAVLLITGFVLSICLSGSSSKAAANIGSSGSYAVYTNKDYNVSLYYSRYWKPNNKYNIRYEGKDGFFQINAFDGGNLKVNEVAYMEITHKLKPYGSIPQITDLTINGQQAALIMPSSDQPRQVKNHAELIITYPHPVIINNNKFSYLILYSDTNNIKKIARTIKFIDLQ